MAIQLTLRKGTKIQNDAFTGAEAELTYDSTSKGLRIHDGSTQGGIDVPTAATADYVVESQLPTSANNYTWYRKYKSGWVEQGGTTVLTNTSGGVEATLAIEMADTNYSVTACAVANDGTWISTWVRRGSTTKVIVDMFNLSGRSKGTTTWEVRGMAA